MIKVGVLLATGFEEIEAVTPIDTLRRAGVQVTTIGIGSKSITGSHNITIDCDTIIENLDLDLDCIVLPGGMPGAKNISESKEAISLIEKTYNLGGTIAGICASPGVVLGKTAILESKNFTCYPGFEKYVSNAVFSENRVVVDGKIITSRGPGTALEFALTLVKELVSTQEYLKIKEGMLVL